MLARAQEIAGANQWTPTSAMVASAMKDQRDSNDAESLLQARAPDDYTQKKYMQLSTYIISEP
jgi:hypothetical protein